MYFKPVSALIISLSLLATFSEPLFAEDLEVKDQVITQKRALMGTEVMMKVSLPTGKKAASQVIDVSQVNRAISVAFDEVLRIEKLMSSFKPESELSRINQQAGNNPVSVSEELYGLIAKAQDFSVLTEGAFDISFASVGKLWDFRGKIVPTPAALKAALPLVNYKKIILNETKKSVFLAESGMSISLGGIAKGYAMDRAMAILKKHGIKNAMVMAGGDTLISGQNDGQNWLVGLRDPDNQKGIVAILPLSNEAISTSGDYERFFMKDGIRYHHILNTKTGQPARLCRSVSILAKDATSSDALSTSVFAMGPKAGLALIETLDGVEGIVIDTEGKWHLSSGLTSLDQGSSD